MPKLTRPDAERLLDGLHRKREDALDAGDMGEVQVIDRRIRAVENALAEGGEVVTVPNARPSGVPEYQGPPKDKNIAGLLALLLGGIGAHKFYLGKPGVGVVYLLFCWTAIPAIVGFFEAIAYFTSDPRTFARRYAS